MGKGGTAVLTSCTHLVALANHCALPDHGRIPAAGPLSFQVGSLGNLHRRGENHRQYIRKEGENRHDPKKPKVHSTL